MVSDSEQLYAEHLADLDEEWHEVFDQLTSQGKSPSGIKATIEYVTTPKTQQEVSEEYNVSEVTIRNLQVAVIALGPIDDKRGSTHSGGGRSAMDICTHLADILGWEEGVEYSVIDSAYSMPQPRLLKEGWRQLYEEFSLED